MGTVFHREHAAGVDGRLLRFLDWWAEHGPFPITIPATGGLRTDAMQAELYAKGRTTPGEHAGEPGHPPMGRTVTNAKTVHDTPHGRGAALDCMPVKTSADGTKVVALIDSWDLYRMYGIMVKAHGLIWGGEWRSPLDGPHAEILTWRSLPIPNPGVHHG